MGKVVSKVTGELRELLPAMSFFFIVFHMLAATRAVLTGRSGFSLFRSSVALAAAFTVAHSISLVRERPFARRFDERPMMWAILWKTLIFGTVTMLFHWGEELFHGILRTHDLGQAVDEMVHALPLSYRLIIQMWLWSAVFLFTIVTEIVERFGLDRVRAVLFHDPAAAGPGSAPHGH
jgi:hypothetical protein